MHRSLRQLVRNTRRALHRPHRHLGRRWDWYARWHAHPARDRTHGTIAVGFMFLTGTLLAQVTTGLRSEIVPATPTVTQVGTPPRADVERRQCGDRMVVTETIGTERHPIRFKDPIKDGRWVLAVNLVRPTALADPVPTRLRQGSVDCGGVREVRRDQAFIDLSDVRIRPDCARCNLDGVRARRGNTTLTGTDTFVVATGDRRAHGQWTLSGIRVTRILPAGGPELDRSDLVVLTLGSV